MLRVFDKSAIGVPVERDVLIAAVASAQPNLKAVMRGVNAVADISFLDARAEVSVDHLHVIVFVAHDCTGAVRRMIQSAAVIKTAGMIMK